MATKPIPEPPEPGAGRVRAPAPDAMTELFSGGFPTLEAQYILKDLILAAAWSVIAAQTLGARLIPRRSRNNDPASVFPQA